MNVREVTTLRRVSRKWARMAGPFHGVLKPIDDKRVGRSGRDNCTGHSGKRDDESADTAGSEPGPSLMRRPPLQAGPRSFHRTGKRSPLGRPRARFRPQRWLKKEFLA